VVERGGGSGGGEGRGGELRLRERERKVGKEKRRSVTRTLGVGGRPAPFWVDFSPGYKNPGQMFSYKFYAVISISSQRY
jgi:hypothetical protein